jgi:hypothetical protein
MGSPCQGLPSRLERGLRRALWAGLSVGWILPSVGCQVEYAGMTLPSGKYMHDDVQYFPPSPAFPWAQTQAATQRARMREQGIDPGPDPMAGPLATPRVPPGGLQRGQNVPGAQTDVNASGVIAPSEAGQAPGANPPTPVPPPPAPGGVPAPPAPGVPAPAPGGVPAPGGGAPGVPPGS